MSHRNRVLFHMVEMSIGLFLLHFSQKENPGRLTSIQSFLFDTE